MGHPAGPESLSDAPMTPLRALPGHDAENARMNAPLPRHAPQAPSWRQDGAGFPPAWAQQLEVSCSS